MEEHKNISIDYLPYAPPLQIEQTISEIRDLNGLEKSKAQILNYFFSLRKDNRNLARRMQAYEDQLKQQKAQTLSEKRQSVAREVEVLRP